MNYRHGKCGSRAYRIWAGMMTRCLNPNEPAYPRYGGRGISVCDQWRTFEGFYTDMGDPPEGLSLDRVDNDQGYRPDNCRWATRQQQGRNKSNNRLLTVDGETAAVTVHAERRGLSAGVVLARLRLGWTPSDAVNLPLVSNRKGVPRGMAVHRVGAEQGVVFADPEPVAPAGQRVGEPA